MASKDEIKRQIAALQTQLAQTPESPPAKKQRSNGGIVLAPATPSPKRRMVAGERAQSPTNSTRRMRETRPKTRTDQKLTHGRQHASNVKSQQLEPSAKALFISQLKELNVNKTDGHEAIVRTDGFDEKPTSADTVKAPVRDDRLAIVEKLELGPAEHKSIPDDPNFIKIEPNSGIRLKERMMPHASLQDHLTGRYFLPPCLLYSVARIQPNKQAYEVPVEGDWVTIAVVAERGDVKFTSGPGNVAHGKAPADEKDDVFDAKNAKDTSRKRKKVEEDEDEEGSHKGRKKYVHLKLIDLGHRSRSSVSSSDSPRGTLRGDAQLSLLLFESDYFDKLIDRNGKADKVQKLWRGGSGGAFEECFPRLREGTVIALLNPKVLKPFTNSRNPSSSSILALTPPSASAIAIIGYAADLGRCTVVKRDGKPCGSWVDKRVSHSGTNTSERADSVCEYHIQFAVQRTRAGRAEFSIGTSGLSSTAHKRKPAYDPERHWGLKPESGSRGPEGETTYVIGGLVASSSRSQTLGSTSGTMGREEQARARRKAGVQEDTALVELLSKGSSGATSGSSSEASREALIVVQRAREAVMKARKGERGDSSAKDNENGNPRRSGEEAGCEQPQKKPFSVDVVKHLGFDPTVKAYNRRRSGARPGKSDTTNGLSKQPCPNRAIQLGPPPGPKVRSGVSVPAASTGDAMVTGTLIYSSGIAKTDEPAIEETETSHAPVALGTVSGSSRPKAKTEIDSDSDLEIEPPCSEMCV